MARMYDTREGAPLVAPRTGLLVCASVPSGERTRWANGLDWLPEMVPEDSGDQPWGARALSCVDGDAVGQLNKPSVEQADAFSVFAVADCSTMQGGLTGADWQGIARRRLAATESMSIASEFWLGTIAQAEGLVNAYLTDGGATSAGSVAKPAVALATLELFVQEAVANGRVMIHCSPEVLVRLATAQAIRREGSLWLTPCDSIVCADGGYDGLDHKQQSAAVMYATTIPTILLGSVDVTPLDESAVYVPTNDLRVIAQREVMVLWDSTVLHASINVDLT